MWEPFTEEARRSIVMAQDLCEKINNSSINSGILLFGLLAEEESQAYKLLKDNNVDPEEILDNLTIMFENTDGKFDETNVVFTVDAKRVIELSFEEARNMKHNYIGSEHMLIACLRYKYGLAYAALKMAVNDTDELYTKLTS